MINGAIGFEKMKEVQLSLRKSSFPTNFNFLATHSGLRKAELSLLISPNGSGKSTLVRTIVFELLKAGKKVLIYLSEEQACYYISPLYQCAYIMMRNNESGANELMRNLFVISAFDKDKIRTVNGVISKMREAIATEFIDAIFIDNFTASFFGNGTIKEQGDAVMSLKELAIDFDLPVILVAHTTKAFDVYTQDMRGDSVRGNATTANVGSYNYCISTFWRGEKPRSIVYIDKARYHGRSQKRFFELDFDKDFELFTSDKEISEKEFNDAKKEVKSIKRAVV